MTFDDWFDKHYPNNDDPLLRRAKRIMWDEIAAAMEPAQPAYPNYGWLCPRCGRGNAPSTGTCPCVPELPIVWTC